MSGMLLNELGEASSGIHGMSMGESEMNVMNGMSPCYAPSYVNTRGAQPGLRRLPNHVGTREMGPFRNTHQEQLSS